MFCTAQESEYKYEIERTNRELQEMKRKYYQLRRREEAEDDEGDDAQAGEMKCAGCLDETCRGSASHFLSFPLLLLASHAFIPYL